MEAMRGAAVTDFYEEDESLEDIRAAFAEGEKGTTQRLGPTITGATIEAVSEAISVVSAGTAVEGNGFVDLRSVAV
jgi:hypothetical protein